MLWTQKSVDPWFCFLCVLIQVRKHSKHCRSCDKCVDGFDHHCRVLHLILSYSFSFLRLLYFFCWFFHSFEILFLEFCWNNIEQTAMICVLGICLFMLGVLCVMLRLFCMWSLLPWNVLDWISLGRHTGYLNSENYIDKDFTSRMLCNYWLHGWSSSQYAIIWVSELASN